MRIAPTDRGVRGCFINIRVCDGGQFRPVLGERLQQYVDIAKKADTEMGENGPVPKGCRQKSRLTALLVLAIE
jgi:hypothetical protein